MPMGDPGGHFADTGGYGSFNQGGGGFQTGGALNGGRGEYGLAGDRSFNSGNVGAYSQNALGNNFGNPIYSNPIPAAKRVNPITQQVVNPNPYTTPPTAPAPGYNSLPPESIYNQYSPTGPGGMFGGVTGTYNPSGYPNDGYNNSTQGTMGGGFGGYASMGGNPVGGFGSGLGGFGGSPLGNGGGPGSSIGWANGGMIMPGQSGWVGERGPEFAQGMPGGGVAITPNHMLGNPPPRPMGPPMTLPPAQQPGMGGGRMSGGGFRGMLGY